MNRAYVLLFLLLPCSLVYSQKYALIDKKMSSSAITYSDKITLQYDQQGLFPVEKDKLGEFITALEKIAKQLADKKIPESSEYSIGNTHFKVLKLPLKNEDRIDIIITTDCGSVAIDMHLVDAKTSCSSNLYYLKAWIKYIKNALK